MTVDVHDILARFPEARPCGPGAVLIRCPFHRHQDGSPERCASMKVNLETARFLCFSCRQEGDLDDLVQRVGQ